MLGRAITSNGSLMKKEFSVFVVLVFGGMLAWLYWANIEARRPQPMTGRDVPAFSLTSLDGKKFSTEEAKKQHKVYLINFWATHCAPCREEMPVLESLYKSMDPSWFEFVSINEDTVKTDEERRTLIDKFRAKVPFSFEVYGDRDFFVADHFGTTRIPETFVVDGSGKIVAELRGLMTEEDKKRLMQQLQSLEPKQ